MDGSWLSCPDKVLVRLEGNQACLRSECIGPDNLAIFILGIDLVSVCNRTIYHEFSWVLRRNLDGLIRPTIVRVWIIGEFWLASLSLALDILTYLVKALTASW